MKPSLAMSIGVATLLVVGVSAVIFGVEGTQAPRAGDEMRTAGTLPTPSTMRATTSLPVRPVVSWIRVPSANQGSLHNELRAVGIAGPTAWAVGLYFNGTSDVPLIERRNGTSWQVVANRPPGSKHAELDAVAGSSTANVWSVGRFEPALGQERTLAEHWDGSHWSIVATANRGSFHNELDSLAVRGVNDVWAVGHSDLNIQKSDEALVEHWNGLYWTLISSASLLGSNSEFAAITSIPNSSYLWAVGDQRHGAISTTLVELWNGHQWSVVPSLNYGVYSNILTSVVALSSHDAWAVGTYFVRLVPHAIIEHWNGRYWSLVRGPSEIAHHYSLSGVTAIGSHRIIAVGQVFSGRTDRTLIIESDGSNWTVDRSANAGMGHNQLNAVATALRGTALAVGTSFNGRADRVLVMTSREENRP